MNKIIKKLEQLDFLTIRYDSNATVIKNITTSIPKREEFEKQGIDFKSSIKSLHIDEATKSIAKKVFTDITSIYTDITDIDLDSIINKQIREDKLKELFGEEIVKTPIHQNTQSMQKLVYMSVINKINKLDANIIITNGSMASVLQDVPQFNSVYSGSVSTFESLYQYKIGSINNCDIYVDAYLKFNDNRIMIGNVDYEIFHNDTINFSDDFTEMSFGYDQKLNPNSKVEGLNIIDSNMLLL